MATYKTKAIILSSYPYREHDRIVSFFSEDYGRLEARARGTRKLESKLAGHLEPFIETELLLAHGRHWDILAGSRTLVSRSLVRGDLELLAAAGLCAEAVKLITKPQARDQSIFALLTRTLRLLEAERLTKAARRSLVISFIWRLLSISGFAPELRNCIHCRRAVGSGAFSFDGGGALCRQCAARDIGAVPLTVEALRHLQNHALPDAPELRTIVIGFWRRVVDYAELRSWGFWEELKFL